MKKNIINISAGNRAIYQTNKNGLPELYCIHGGMGLGSDSLIKDLMPLAKSFDLIFIDLRGCGDSDKASDEQYNLRDFSNDIIEIVNSVSTNRVRGILGHSLGGMISLDLLSCSDLFQFSILSNTALNDKWQSASREAVKTLNQNELNLVLENYKQFYNDEVLKELAITYGPIYFPELDNTTAKKVMSEFNYRIDAMAFTSEKVYPAMNLASQVEKIKIPTLIISGNSDIIVPVCCQKELAQHLTNSTLKIINDSGHFPFVTKNNEFINSIQTWWNNTKEVLK